jgi:hypothetical protein
MEIEVCTTPQPVAVFTLCEGACVTGKASRVVITGRKISFSLVEELRNGDGSPATPLTLNFVGRLKGDVLVVHNADHWEIEERLKRVANPTPAQKALLECNATAGWVRADNDTSTVERRQCECRLRVGRNRTLRTNRGPLSPPPGASMGAFRTLRRAEHRGPGRAR